MKAAKNKKSKVMTISKSVKKQIKLSPSKSILGKQSMTASKLASSKKPAMKRKGSAKINSALSSEKAKAAGQDVIDLILIDHKPLKSLIETLKSSEATFAKKRPAFEKFAPALTVHAKSEEESLYVQMKKFKDLKVEAYEGETEHGLADQLVHELKALVGDGSEKLNEKNTDKWMAKVKVLAELVEHHIEEEEGEMFKEINKEFDIEIRMQIGEEYSRLVNFHKTQINKEEVSHEKQSDEIEQGPQHAVWTENEKLEKHKDFYR